MIAVLSEVASGAETRVRVVEREGARVVTEDGHGVRLVWRWPPGVSAGAMGWRLVRVEGEAANNQMHEEK